MIEFEHLLSTGLYWILLGAWRALPLIGIVHDRWGFDTLFLILAASAAVILAAVACLPQRLPTPATA